MTQNTGSPSSGIFAASPWQKLTKGYPPLHQQVLVQLSAAVGYVCDVACYIGVVDGVHKWILADVFLESSQIKAWAWIYEEEVMKTFREYEDAAVSTAIYPGQGTALGLMYVALKMNGEAGELAEHVGKAMRDDALTKEFVDAVNREDPVQCALLGELTPERRALCIKEVGDVLWYAAATARELGTSLEDIAVANIEKLAKRKAEGKLGGSGDNR